jgi:predicted enzyme related to lactoylglutathione lyase
MTTAINWFEIPTTNLERATRFYETALGKPLKHEVFGGTPMAVFTYADPGVGGALIQDERRKPSADGAILYLAVDGQLDEVLARVPKAGGAVVLGRTHIGDPGYIGMIRDTEGNVIGIHSPT